MADFLRPSQAAVIMGRRRRTGTGRKRTATCGNKTVSEDPVNNKLPQVKLENSYHVKPQETEKFQSSKVEKMMGEALEEKLKDVTYDSNTCQSLAKDLATEILKRVKNFHWQRYKLVCQVTVGQQTLQSLQVASRCIWDQVLDSHASVTYHNESVFAVAQCYGIYYE